MNPLAPDRAVAPIPAAAHRDVTRAEPGFAGHLPPANGLARHPGQGMAEQDVSGSAQAMAAVQPSSAEAVMATALVESLRPLDTSTLLGEHARIYEQGLHVIGYLSMLGGHAEASTRGASTGAAMDDITTVVSSSLPVYEAASAATPVVTDATLVAGIASAVPAWLPSETAAAAESVAMPELPAALARQPWARQLQRWSRYGDELTLWIRDYRLDSAQTRELSACFAAEAARSGVVLSRIVVNGQQAWSTRSAAAFLYQRDQSHGR